ncbi:MAG: AraC family transcriptional regulator [Acidobacteriota bacterium]|nr:AraC family transcriptional regulator [Acidobacteriota bacterium]
MKQSPPPLQHRPQLVRHHQTSEMNFCEVLYPPHLRQARHTHQLASFSYVLSGSYAESLDRHTHRRQPSTVVFHPPGESHAVEFEDNVLILGVEFSFEKLSCISRQSVIFEASASCRSEKTNWLGGRIYQEFQRMDAFSMLAIEGLILELLAEASRQRAEASEKSCPRWLKQSKDFLHANFNESFTLEEIARVAGVHPVHLSRVFREKFGCTIGEYVRRLRVEFASRQILSGEDSLGEIAHAAGFSDQSHFNKIFKTAFGLTPAEYRKTFRRRS